MLKLKGPSRAAALFFFLKSASLAAQIENALSVRFAGFGGQDTFSDRAGRKHLRLSLGFSLLASARGMTLLCRKHESQ